MKKIIAVGFLMVCAAGVYAQTFAEWFAQNKTRLTYYEQQIGFLQVYIGYAEKGYKIVENGLNTIKDIKNGEFTLHNAFYSSLESISPQVGKMAEIAEIVALQIAIIKKCSQSLAGYRQNKYLQSDELSYIGQVYSTVLNAGLKDINTLLDITTANKLKMTDAQRMEKIKYLDQDMRDQYGFTNSFTDRTDLLSAQRQAEGTDIGSMKAWYGLP